MVDILMTFALLLLMSYELLGSTAHEVVGVVMFVLPYKFSISLSHIAELASLGILQSPRGLIEILPTLGPSGKQERLNC